MTFHQEKAREIPVAGEFDVIVAGGGPAGIGAALGAARCGARTLIIEEFGCFGGMITSGMMSHWTGSTVSPVMLEIQNGIHALKYGNEADDVDPRVIDHDKAKLVIFELLEQAGVTMLLHSRCVEPIMEGDAVRGVIIENKSGRRACLARTLIDCTGDGDLAARCGAAFDSGREGDGKMQPVTLMFKIGGVDPGRAVYPGSFETTVDTPKGELQSLARQLLPPPAGHVLLYKSAGRGQVTVNMTNLTGIDGSDAADLTRAEITCHRQIPAIIRFLREYVPGYENCYWLSTAGVVGVRETRRFKGEYQLTADDIQEAKVFDDWIATRNMFNFDIHNVEGAGLDAHGAQKHFHSRGAYTIPYRSCLPLKIENLLLAGRCICGTHKAHSNYRAMPICANIGLGVGVAAALAAREGIPPRRLDVRRIQRKLHEFGVEV